MSLPIRIGWTVSDAAAAVTAISREWLITNGLGGYASGTIGGIPTRRYHGLLIAALPNPYGRVVMCDRLTEEVGLPDGTHIPLAPHLEEFRLALGIPEWRFRVGRFLIEKRMFMVHRQNTVHAQYCLLEAPAGSALGLTLRPAFNLRSHEAPLSSSVARPYSLFLHGDRCEISAGPELPDVRMRIFGGPSSAFGWEPAAEDELDYVEEGARGYQARGRVRTQGRYDVRLSIEQPVFLIVSAEPWELIDPLSPGDALAAERKRRARLITLAEPATGAEIGQDSVLSDLVLAADQFLIAPLNRQGDSLRARAEGEEPRTVIAGYHWFTDWGRDTMISLEGLTLCTGRWEEARGIIHTFARHVRNGLIPNLFPEGAHQGLYHTADATLWFFHALGRYLGYTGDRHTLRLLWPVLLGIVDAHVQGTQFGIRVDPDDGLVGQGEEGYALTWMDAKCDGWVVTPRRGKAVEINALWFNALSLMGRWARDLGESGSESFFRMAATTGESFNRRFWFAEGGYLYDLIDGTKDGSPDSACRPNQILAVSLPHPPLAPERWARVVERVGAELLTPYGLRSLSPGHSDYKPNYHGDLRTRDAAYHQGTVWSWLMGPFVDAWLRVHPGREAEAHALLAGLAGHLGEGCVGSVSEIFDADLPFGPRGCVAQAWGVAELLRVWKLTRP